jgi:hypothetical protein
MVVIGLRNRYLVAMPMCRIRLGLALKLDSGRRVVMYVYVGALSCHPSPAVRRPLSRKRPCHMRPRRRAG